MRTLRRLALASALVLLLPAQARAAFGVIPGVVGLFPIEADAPDVMVGATAFYEVLPWLVVRGGAYQGASPTMSLWHFPISVGYVLPQGGDIQLRPRLQIGVDPFVGQAGDRTGFSSEWHIGLGLDYLPWDNHWVIGSSVQLIMGQFDDDDIEALQGRPVVGPWLVRAEIGIGYKF